MSIINDKATEAIEVVDLDSSEIRTLLVDATRFGVDTASSVISALQYAVDDARDARASEQEAEREKARQRAASRRQRPFWQAEPCPDWCGMVHQEGDEYKNRFHNGKTRVVPRTMGDSLKNLDGTLKIVETGLLDLPCVRVFLTRHEGHARPHIAIRADSGDRTERIDLKLAEALELATALIELVNSADVVTTETER